MALLTGVFTSIGRVTMAKAYGRVAGYPDSYPTHFKIGMGGYIVTPAGRSPKDPDPALTNIEADDTPGNIFIQKALVPLDFTFISITGGGIMQVRCRLEPGEGNDDGTGNPPRFFEIGVFDANNVMLIYTTFAEQSKSPSKILSNFVQAYF